MSKNVMVKSVVGEENFIDMQPNRSNNFCCGGGFLQSGYKEERLEFGRLKDIQIQATGADYGFLLFTVGDPNNLIFQIHT